MTDTDIVTRLAREAGFQDAWWSTPPHEPIKRLIALVAEKCAKVCDEQAAEPECPERAKYCAEAIRAHFVHSPQPLT